MKKTESIRVCPMCHCMLWEEDFLKEGDLDPWEDGCPHGGEAAIPLDDLVDRAVDALFDGRVVVHLHLAPDG